MIGIGGGAVVAAGRGRAVAAGRGFAGATGAAVGIAVAVGLAVAVGTSTGSLSAGDCALPRGGTGSADGVGEGWAVTVGAGEG